MLAGPPKYARALARSRSNPRSERPLDEKIAASAGFIDTTRRVSPAGINSPVGPECPLAGANTARSRDTSAGREQFTDILARQIHHTLPECSSIEIRVVIDPADDAIPGMSFDVFDEPGNIGLQFDRHLE